MSPYGEERLVGILTVSAIFFAPAILSLLSMRSRSTNKKCALSAVFFFGIWYLTAALGILGMQMPQVVNVLLGLVLLAGFPASIILAIFGLLELARHPRRREKGKKRAIAVLVLCGLMLVSMLFALVAGVVNNRQTANLPEKTLTYDDLNFQITPPRPWMEAGVKLNSDATVSLLHGSPEIFAIIIAEKVGMASPLTSESLAGFVKNRLASASPSTSISTPLPAREQGMDVVKLEGRTDAGVFQTFWLAVHNGYSYQLICWGNLRFQDEIQSQAALLASQFNIIDPTRKGRLPGEEPVTDFHSSGYGFTVKTSDSEWTRPWRDLANDAPLAEFGTLSTDGKGALTVTPVYLFGTNPGLDALRDSVITRLKGYSSNVVASDETRYTRDGFEGIALTVERTAEGQRFIHRIRILKGKDRVYVLDAWHTKSSESELPYLDEELDLVAIDPEPQSSPDPGALEQQEAIRHAFVFNDIGMSYFKLRQYPESLEYFRRAFEFTKSDPSILGNGLEALLRAGKYKEGLEYANQYIDKFPQDKEPALTRALLQSLAGDPDGSIRNYADVFSTGYRNDEHFTTYLGLLSRQGEENRAIDECEKYLAQGDSTAIRIEEAWLYCKTKNSDKAIALLKEQEAKHPADPILAQAIADIQFSAENYTETISLCEKLIADGYESAYTTFLLGRARFAIKRYPEAKEAFEASLKKDPTNRDVRSFLDFVSGMLGEGENSAVKNPIDPVPVPEGAPGSPEEGGSAEYLRDWGAYYTRKTTSLSYAKDKENKITRRGTLKILDSNSVSKFSTLQFPFDPLSEELFVNSLVVKDAAGKTVSEGKVSDCYIVDDKSSDTATQRKSLCVPVRGLQPGHTLEYCVTWRDLGTEGHAPFFQHTFSDSVPVLQSALFLYASPGFCKSLKNQAVPEPLHTDGALCWVVNTPVVYKHEPFQEPVEKFLPTVWIDGSASEWKPLCADYLSSISEKLKGDRTIRETAQRETAGLKSGEEKIPALCRFVQRSLVYKAIEFGRRARIPNTPQEILDNKYGDCKDHAVLLRQLLEESGITAHLVLVNTNGGIQKTLPSLDQFNHMIVFIPDKDGGRFVDCTGKEMSVETRAPIALGGKEVLILEKENPRFATIPPMTSKIGILRRIDLTPDMKTTIHDKVQMEGYPAICLRQLLNAVEPMERKTALIRELTASVPSIEIENIEIENANLPGIPLVIDISYFAKQRFHKSRDQLVGRIPVLWEHFFLSDDPSEKRQSPFCLNYPIEISGTSTFTIPGGFKIQDESPVTGSIKNRFITSRMTEKRTDDESRLDFTLSVGSGHFPAEAYKEYQKEIKLVLDSLEPEIILKKSEG